MIWICGVIRERIMNGVIRGTTKMGKISKKMRGSRLKRYGHVMIREEEYAMDVLGKRRK